MRCNCKTCVFRRTVCLTRIDAAQETAAHWAERAAARAMFGHMADLMRVAARALALRLTPRETEELRAFAKMGFTLVDDLSSRARPGVLGRAILEGSSGWADQSAAAERAAYLAARQLEFMRLLPIAHVASARPLFAARQAARAEDMFEVSWQVA